MNRPSKSSEGLTLFEVIIVIALLMGTMIYALPTLVSSTDHSGTMRALQTEIKSAFDSAVLTGLPHRLVFDLNAAQIYVERLAAGPGDSTSSTGFHRDSDPVAEKQRRDQLEQSFEIYRELSRGEVSDFDNDRKLPPTSPLLRAYDQLLGAPWEKTSHLSHQPISFGEGITVTRYRTERNEAEHFITPPSSDSEANIPPISLYFYPRGYAEKAYFVFRERGDDGAVLDDTPPYVLVIRPFEGVADLSSRAEDATISGES